MLLSTSPCHFSHLGSSEWEILLNPIMHRFRNRRSSFSTGSCWLIGFSHKQRQMCLNADWAEHWTTHQDKIGWNFIFIGDNDSLHTIISHEPWFCTLSIHECYLQSWINMPQSIYLHFYALRSTNGTCQQRSERIRCTPWTVIQWVWLRLASERWKSIGDDKSLQGWKIGHSFSPKWFVDTE
jgi:hypothetical protein